jgi:hypothetical protein
VETSAGTGFLQVEWRLNLPPRQKEITLCGLRRRGSQVVRQGSAKASFVGSIPTLASM